MYLNKIKYCFTKVLVFILAFQILNLSVHSGAQATIKPGSMAIGANNQIDCFFEYFFENICSIKYDDANDLDLHNKSQNGHKSLPKLIDIQMPVQRLVTIQKASFNTTAQNHFPIWNGRYEYLYAREITPPPPKHSIV